MSQVNPNIVFIPGVWHTTSGYPAVANLLEAAGYDTKMVELESVGGPPVPGFEPNVEAIRQAIEPACDLTKT
jgi:hypothetical protein